MILLCAVPLMTLCGSLGALFFKRSTQGSQGLLPLLRTPQLYGVGALLNIALLRIWAYSVVYPLTCVTYVWTLFLSHRFLGEPLTRRKLLGIGLVLAGVVILTR